MKIIFLFIFIIFLNCNGFVKTGVRQASSNIQVSKKNKVFICLYKPVNQFVQIGKYSYRIDDVWVEYNWWYKNNDRLIEADKKNINLYLKLYNIEFQKYELIYLPKDSNLIKILDFERFGKYNSYGIQNDMLSISLKDSIPNNIEIKFNGINNSKTINFVKKK